MKQYILELLREVEWALKAKELSKMSLKDRVSHERALVKLEIVRNLLSKFIP